MEPVELGFIEVPERPERLWNIHFPSKVGGKPEWLNLEHVPATSELKCSMCEEQIIFLLQLYAPDTNDHESEAFHRTIFIFVCPNETCNQPNQNGNVKVFRNQIRKKNPFYSLDPAPEDADEEALVCCQFKLCNVCGCRGPFHCAKCKKVSYCGKTHQLIDWKAGHKQHCGKIADDLPRGGSTILFPEFELVLEAEPALPAKQKDDEDPDRLKKEMDKLKEYETSDESSLQNLPESELSKYAAEVPEDKFFSTFRKRIAIEPQQVLRYRRRDQPLWIAEANRLDSSKVPKCPNCNKERVFEFQVMPQLLNSLKSDSLDWGILAVYTCIGDCGTEGKYLPEFVYKQDIVN